jgi:hypothetical protein
VRAARPDAAGVALALGESRLSWTPDRVEWLDQSARADAEARYFLGGLEAVEHELTCGEERRRVVPPATVDFEAPPARLEVAVRSAGLPVAGARVSVEAGGAVAERPTDAAGGATFELAAAGPFRVTVEAEGLASRTRVVGEGRAEFDLGPAGDLAGLAVALQPLGGAPLAATCTLELTAPDSPDPFAAAFRRTVGMDPLGRFVLPDVEPGTWILTATPGGWYLPVVTLVSVRARETAQVSVPVELGGTVTLEFFTPAGQRTRAAAYADVYLPGLPAADGAVVATWRSGVLPAGLCGVLVVPEDPSCAEAYVYVDVRPGESVSAGVTLSPWTDPWGNPVPEGDLWYEAQLR